MKILIVAPTYLPARRANTIQVMKMAEAAILSSHEVHVFVPNPEHKKNPGWESLAHQYGVHQRFSIEWVDTSAGLRGYDYGLKAVFKFRSLGMDMLYTRLPQAAAFASVFRLPSIFEIHDLPSGVLGPLLFRLFIKGQGARRMVLITRSLREALIQNFPDLPPFPFTMVEPDGVDLKRYNQIRPPDEARRLLRDSGRCQLPINQFTVGYTGHFYEGRGIQLILEIASHFPDVNFLLAGGDPQAITAAGNQVRDRELKNVYLTGFIPNAELPQYQAACEVLLMPYQKRVAASSGGDIAQFLSPMKLFEYMACGRVILSSQLPVLEEIINQKNAILLPADDTRAWIEALREIRKDPIRRESLGLQARIDSKNYTWEKRVGRIFSFQ
jgi:glycosyltransferase involved in cell wall biosynthesis